MIILGIVLLLLYYLLPEQPPELLTLEHVAGVILLVVGAVLWILGAVGRPVAGRRYWF